MSSSSTQTILVVGATGATGRHVVHKLLEQGHNVKVIVRSKERMMDILSGLSSSSGEPTEKLTLVEASVYDMSIGELQEHVKPAAAVVCCLGHNMSFSGIWGGPWKLVTESVRKLTQSMLASAESEKLSVPKKFILMGSDGVVNPSGSDDIRPFSERLILSIIRSLVPPHSDNEGAVDVLYKGLGHDATTCPESLEWTVVRPTDLIDGPTTKYILHPKPVGSLFGSGAARRSNVAQCMVDLITQESLWSTWKFKMPVLHDAASVAEEEKGGDASKK